MTPFKGRYPICCLLALTFAAGAGQASPDAYAAARARMIREIEADVGYTSAEIGKKALDPRVMRAMATVERHQFVPASLRREAYANRPLPIGHGQTISQPYIVALMTDLLRIKPNDVVLEIGTGSGYQAAILGKLVKRVYTVEIIEPLAKQAGERLRTLGFRNVEVRHADGYHGWPEHAPFDAIIVTAAGSHIPPPLIRQLKPGGRMVIPVGGGFATQQLVFVQKSPQGKVSTRQVLPVAFVPLTRK
jgi:protein-L-isoaspartate(D-aspartate) O-methyltransferase